MRRAWLLCLVWLSGLAPAQAHLMEAQKGTLNVVDSGAFLVLSLPLSAFAGTTQTQIAQQVQQQVVLRDAQGPRPLQGVLVVPSPATDEPGAPVHQVVVLGRFALAQPSVVGADALRFSLTLYGTRAGEQRTELTVTRGADRSLLVLDATHAEQAVFPSRWQVFLQATRLGVLHILTGPDHLLFLLIVLWSAVGWQQLLAVLTTFTLGHAVTLVLGTLGYGVLPVWLVESAIVCTIVLMLGLEGLLHWRQRVLPLRLRLVLVLGCALVHGLGFAAALRALGLLGERLWPTLVGFNAGIEAGQLGVALPWMAALLWWRGRRVCAPQPRSP